MEDKDRHISWRREMAVAARLAAARRRKDVMVASEK